MADNCTALSVQQVKTIAALFTCRTVAQAAQQAGVGRRTVYTWLCEDEAFQNAVREAEEAAIAGTVRRLCTLADKALSVLAGVLNDTKASQATRVRAAEVVLANLIRLRELRNVEERLVQLEERIYANDVTN